VDNVESRTAGRPRAFEPEDAVAAALDTFWGRGFSEVSVTDLEGSTGIIRTSLYNAFGNKRGLFDAALDYYLTDLSGEIDRRLTSATGGLTDIHQFFDYLESMFIASSRGCFMVNAMIEFGDTDPTITQRANDYIETIAAGFRAALSRAQANDEIPPTPPIGTTANQLVLETLGLNLAVRIGPDPDRLHSLFEAAHHTVRTLQPTADR
jgi:TetR/AcrR family transcriptional regulator, transcriptional repressor for nem operon